MNSEPTPDDQVITRPSLTYSVVNTVIEKEDDVPGLRFGHTLTAIPAVGKEGTRGYIGPRLILFGGATNAEGLTADVHCYDILSNKWSRLEPLGEPPSPRCCHVAAAVGTKVVIQGGLNDGDSLAKDDLYVLDLTPQRPRWHRIVVQGPGPGPRAGHVMASMGQMILLAAGKGDGDEMLECDVWVLDISIQHYEWRKLEPEGEGPPLCGFATANARSDGLLLLYGGFNRDQVPLSSGYCLKKYTDGSWKWTRGPVVSPGRYGHAAVFVNSRLHLSGGLSAGDQMIKGSSSVAVLETAGGVWHYTKSVVTTRADAVGGSASIELTGRYSHAATAVGNTIYIYGGVCKVDDDEDVLLGDLLVAKDLADDETTNASSHADSAGAPPIKPQESKETSQSGSTSTSGTQSINSNEIIATIALFSPKQITDATDGMTTKIGGGGYGSVYKGKLCDGQVAIKVLDPNSQQGLTEFVQEIDVLGQMRHDNLVKLIGACFQLRSLVYEYIPNGSLEDHIKTKPEILTWDVRTRIIYQTCSALLYLHSRPEPLVHGDLKPDNILLDEHLNIKLADFGMCRFMPPGTASKVFVEASIIKDT